MEAGLLRWTRSRPEVWIADHSSDVHGGSALNRSSPTEPEVHVRPLANRDRPSPRIGLYVGVLIAAASCAAALAGCIAPLTPSTPPPDASSSAVAEAPLPPEVDGLPVLTISQAIAKRNAGELGDRAVAVRGYWSDASVPHGCVPPPGGNAGALEIYCVDREFGMTELNEPIEVISKQGRVTEGTGPWLTPYVTGDVTGAKQLFTLPVINGQRFPPVPIVVVGHFKDSRSVDCRPEAKQLCRDRLVIDRIVVFGP
jgi:hypothetical protein